MNKLQRTILNNAHEDEYLWVVISDICEIFGCSRTEAFLLLMSEIEFISRRSDVHILKSDRINSPTFIEEIDQKGMKLLTLEDLEYMEGRPVFFISTVGV